MLNLSDVLTESRKLFMPNHRLYFSCIDELRLYIDELDDKNFKKKKLINQGLIMKIETELDPIYISFDTLTYQKIRRIIPKNCNPNRIPLSPLRPLCFARRKVSIGFPTNR